MPFKISTIPLNQLKTNYRICRVCKEPLTSKYEVSNNQLEHDKCRQKRFRLLIIEKLGGVCVGCGFSDVRALQIDHKNGGGVKELKTTGRLAYYYRVLRELNNGIIRFQILCANCNWIKRHENNENPKLSDQQVRTNT